MSIVPAASAEVSFDVAWGGPDASVSADAKGRFSSAHASSYMGPRDTDAGVTRCQGSAHYHAETGPITLDFGTHYLAEGGGNVLDYKREETTFPDEAQVADQWSGTVEPGSQLDPWARSKSWIGGTTMTQASAEDPSAKC